MLNLKSSQNRIIAIRQFVQTFCIFAFQDVTPRELDLLCEILACGELNEKAKKNFLLNNNTTKENYSQIVLRLASKGILQDKERRNGKVLHESLKQLSEMYINNSTTNKKIMFLEWTV
jgi:hypothetical protein